MRITIEVIIDERTLVVLSKAALLTLITLAALSGAAAATPILHLLLGT